MVPPYLASLWILLLDNNKNNFRLFYLRKLYVSESKCLVLTRDSAEDHVVFPILRILIKHEERENGNGTNAF